jgi:CheY-like chemotaxis protein
MIALCASDDPDCPLRALAAGADEVIRKPADLAVLARLAGRSAVVVPEAA